MEEGQRHTTVASEAKNSGEGEEQREAVETDSEVGTNTKRVSRTRIPTTSTNRCVNALVEVVDCCSSHYY